MPTLGIYNLPGDGKRKEQPFSWLKIAALWVCIQLWGWWSARQIGVYGGDIVWFWWFIFICDCLIPVTMILCGRMMWKHCPKQINGIVGYRTKMSMKNMDTWKFAHDHAGKLWWKVGWGLLIPTLLLHIPFYGVGENTMGFLSMCVIVIQLSFLIASIFPTERALKNSFNEDGTRR